jgi:molybdate transport system substrate-binding protein
MNEHLNAVRHRACVAPGVIGTALALAVLTGETAGADIRVFSGTAPQAALKELAPEFERATGHRIDFTFRIVGEIQAKLAAGEKADVVLLPAPLLAATEKTVPLRAEI